MKLPEVEASELPLFAQSTPYSIKPMVLRHLRHVLHFLALPVALMKQAGRGHVLLHHLVHTGANQSTSLDLAIKTSGFGLWHDKGAINKKDRDSHDLNTIRNESSRHRKDETYSEKNSNVELSERFLLSGCGKFAGLFRSPTSRTGLPAFRALPACVSPTAALFLPALTAAKTLAIYPSGELS